MATGQALTSLALQAVAEDVSYGLCTSGGGAGVIGRAVLC